MTKFLYVCTIHLGLAQGENIAGVAQLALGCAWHLVNKLRNRGAQTLYANSLGLADARVSTLAQNRACTAAKVESQEDSEGKDNVSECKAFKRSCDPGHGRRDWNCRSIIFRRRDMGDSLPHGCNRRLAKRPGSLDLTILCDERGFARQAVGCGAN